MANLVQTASSVAKVTGPQVTATAGETITAGQPVYIDTAGLVKKAVATSAEASLAQGIALNGASTGQPVTYQTSQTITIGATMVVGRAYYVSATAGSICLEEDLVPGDYPCLIGFASSSTVIRLSFISSQVAKA